MLPGPKRRQEAGVASSDLRPHQAEPRPQKAWPGPRSRERQAAVGSDQVSCQNRSQEIVRSSSWRGESCQRPLYSPAHTPRPRVRALRGLQETRVATREESGVLGFPSRRVLTPRGSLECRRCRLHPWVGRSPGEGNGNPLQYSCLEIPWTEEPGRLESKGLRRVGHN